MDNPFSELSRLESIGALGAALLAFAAAAKKWIRRDNAEGRIDALYKDLLGHMQQAIEEGQRDRDELRREIEDYHILHERCVKDNEDLRKRVVILERMINKV